MPKQNVLTVKTWSLFSPSSRAVTTQTIKFSHFSVYQYSCCPAIPYSQLLPIMCLFLLMRLEIHANTTSARTTAAKPTMQLNAKYSSLPLSLPPLPPLPTCYCSHRMKNNQSLGIIQEFAGRKKEREREKNYIFITHPPFFSVSFSLPVSPSSKSKIINHLPADKISCLMGEQL